MPTKEQKKKSRETAETRNCGSEDESTVLIIHEGAKTTQKKRWGGLQSEDVLISSVCEHFM